MSSECGAVPRVSIVSDTMHEYFSMTVLDMTRFAEAPERIVSMAETKTVQPHERRARSRATAS